jgi:hypothetical protein
MVIIGEFVEARLERIAVLKFSLGDYCLRRVTVGNSNSNILMV